MKDQGVVELLTIASGSSGNCLLLKHGETRLLFDVGISRRRIKEGLETAGVALDELTAIVLTHEHKDHVCALPMIRKYNPEIPIYATTGTARGCRQSYGWSLPFSRVQADHSFQLGSASLRPFSVRHDANEPVGYRIEVGGLKVAIATDLGVPQPHVEHALRGCQVVVLECNYDAEMLRYGNYPGWLKRRISSHDGHLSNHQTGQLLSRIAGPELEHVVLYHLSRENNHPDKAMEAARKGLAGHDRVGLTWAPRKEPGTLMRFQHTPREVKDPRPAKPAIARRRRPMASLPIQGVLPF
ncbi:MAG: MBL fold metallo-hydrolase [Myxococcales bacterium]|nr:MBL fold metallo-hydrolase [Myxococcales bacterium]